MGLRTQTISCPAMRRTRALRQLSAAVTSGMVQLVGEVMVDQHGRPWPPAAPRRPAGWRAASRHGSWHGPDTLRNHDETVWPREALKVDGTELDRRLSPKVRADDGGADRIDVGGDLQDFTCGRDDQLPGLDHNEFPVGIPK